MKTLEEISIKVKQSISLKIIIIGLLTLILLIPANMIQELIRERQFTRDTVVAEIGDKWGRAQTISGPVLAIPYFEITENDGNIYKTYKTFFVLPENLNIKSELFPETRYRGNYKVIVYKSKTHLEGSFILPDMNDYDIDPDCIEWEKSSLIFGISDMRGIQEEIYIRWNEENLSVKPGVSYTGFVNSGFTSEVILNQENIKNNFSLVLNLNGSENLNFVPVGKTTNVKVSSQWPTPSFMGSFLPDNRNISENGFEANWTILHLNRNFPQLWNNQTHFIDDSSFGVGLLFPVDEYQKSMRSAKYAFMFIALTFLIFLLVEIIIKIRIHPVQYLLVGTALLLFYTLLMSLSEQIGFNLAYIISSISIVSLITTYFHSILKKARLTAITTFSLVVLYTFLFVILQLESYSLLFGSIGLFIILGFVMYISKKVNWYGNLINDDNQRELNS